MREQNMKKSKTVHVRVAILVPQGITILLFMYLYSYKHLVTKHKLKTTCRLFRPEL